MVLWIVDDDKIHLKLISSSITRHPSINDYKSFLTIRTFPNLRTFHKAVKEAQDSKITPPDLVIADYNFQIEGNWILYLKKFFPNESFPFRYMILSQSITPDEIVHLRMNDPSSLYVKMKQMDENFQDFLISEDVHADIISDLIVSSFSSTAVRRKYGIPADFAKGKTNDLLNLVIENRGISKSEICSAIDVSIDSFNKIKSRINNNLENYNVAIATKDSEKKGYHLLEVNQQVAG